MPSRLCRLPPTPSARQATEPKPATVVLVRAPRVQAQATCTPLGASARAATKLANDPSAYAIYLNNPTGLSAMVADVDVRNAMSREESTRRKDE